MLKFKIEDFFPADSCDVTEYTPNLGQASYVTKKAQQIFDKWIENNSKVVYTKDPFKHSTRGHTRHTNCNTKALLINIEPIEKCEHPIEQLIFKYSKTACNEVVIKCCSCNVELRPTGFEEMT